MKSPVLKLSLNRQTYRKTRHDTSEFLVKVRIVIVCQWVVAISPAAVRLSSFLVLVATTAAAVQQRGCVKGLLLLKDIATIWTEEG